MNFEIAIPILYSTDINRSLDYYTEQLGFDKKWQWDTPATFGGVSRNDVNLFFCKEDQGHAGTWISIVLDNVDEYYESIKDKGAIILSTPDTKPWFMREMLVKDPDGHVIRFGHRTECD